MSDLTPDQANLVVSLTDETTFVEAQVLASAPVGTEGGLVVRNITLSQASTTSGQLGTLVQGASSTLDPTYVTGQTNPLSLDLSGRLRTETIQQNAYSTQLGESFSIVMDSINAAAAATDNGILFINNPSGSGKTLFIQEFIVGIQTANRGVLFQIYADPLTTSNGTAISAVNNLIGNVTVSVASAFTLPTVTSVGKGLRGIALSQNSTAIIESINSAIQLPPGHTLLLTADPSANNTVITVTLTWFEK